MSSNRSTELHQCVIRFQHHRDVKVFLDDVSCISDVATVISGELADAYRANDFLQVELLVQAGMVHPSPELVPIACLILRERSECLNIEEVVDLLAILRSPNSIECLAETLNWIPDWDEFRHMGVKCIWALAAIGTEDARLVIRSQLESESPQLREAAIKVLEKDTAASVGTDPTPKTVC
jgi:hypothetical protein